MRDLVEEALKINILGLAAGINGGLPLVIEMLRPGAPILLPKLGRQMIDCQMRLPMRKSEAGGRQLDAILIVSPRDYLNKKYNIVWGDL